MDLRLSDAERALRDELRAWLARTLPELESLRTRAVRDGEEYVVNGQKIWSSFAHVADWAEVLVRTDPDAPKHKGITWLMVDMATPGITVRPIETALGSSEFCEVFYDD